MVSPSGSSTPASRIALSWSSGKDSAWALHLLRQSPAFEVAALVTSFNGAADRVAMHAVRRELLHAQAERTGVPLYSVDLPWPCCNAEYESLMGETFRRIAAMNIGAIAFGDLFLQDIRDYRERQMAATGLTPLFPVWGFPTRQLALDMMQAGIRAKVTCIDPAKLLPAFAGREWDAEFLADLPAGVDPCGENGEFHTFVYDAPVFSSPLQVKSGAIEHRDGFVFADIMPS